MTSGGRWGVGNRLSFALRQTVCLLAAIAIVGVPPIDAQNLEQYDYENLGVNSLGFNLTYVSAKDTDDGFGFEIRSDLGFLGPRVRVVPRFGYWKNDVNGDQIQALETRIAELALLPPSSISLGSIERSVYLLGADFQWTLRGAGISPYAGVGIDVYLLNDSGASIEGTFLDDSVITAGVSGVAGLEFALQGGWVVYGDIRGSLVTDANNVAIAGGAAYYFGGR